MSIDWPVDLVRAIARRRAVILIGSGVSANAKNQQGASPPTWRAFLEEAKSGLSKTTHIGKAIKEGRYLEACDFLKTAHGDDNWKRLVRESFQTPNYRAQEIHQAIFDLDSRVVASLNFDQIYDRYAISRSQGTFVIKRYCDGDIRQVVAGEDRYLLKPHGSIDDADRMIFTLSDYAAARVGHAHFYETLNALIHTHTFLCLGCGLSDPDMALLFEDYRYKHNESPHYMTQPSPVSGPEKDLIRNTRGINILTYSPKDHHKALTVGLQNLVSLVRPMRDEISDAQSW